MHDVFQILVYGVGNPGRRDDGLGPELVRILEEWARRIKTEGIFFDSNYQLNVEDAEIISRYDRVIFADASVEDIRNFTLTRLTEEDGVTYTTHAASPGYILKLCHELFGKNPEAYLLHIKGYEWDFRAGLTKQARENLVQAAGFMQECLVKPALFEKMVTKSSDQ